MRDLLAGAPVIPVVVVDSAREGVEVGRALLAGGVATAEVTFRTAAAREAIIAMRAEVGGLTVGAGTVVNRGQVESAISAGAQYVVSPGFSAEVIVACQEAGIPVLPSCTDGSWIMAALDRGIRTVKFFPAEPLGGVRTIRALTAPFPAVSFVPTGGISSGNLAAYLSVDSVMACGGSWMVTRDLVREGAWSEISRLAAEAMAIAKGAGR